MLPVTDLQLDVLRVLWARGEAAVAEVCQDLSQQRQLAPTTVATLLSRLAKRGLVTHRSEGRRHLYRALLSETALREQVLDTVTEEVFDGDVAALVCQLLDARGVAPGDLDRVRQLIDGMDPEDGDDR
ncbi:MAG: BlaI/MecI/CopY family transcriptional regulator [Planctomycetota bacterium]|nr:MAG: BlaI/MecI/CopY family transcriptional regulator [Planctomycetota bacterium]